MSETVTFTGGARLGWVNATWPFGRLSISSGRLTIALAFAGRYTFAPSEVSRLERCGLAANGLRIVHTRADCPDTIIFWCGGGRVQRVLDAATRAGFDPHLRPSTSPRRGMPFRWVAVAQVVLAWNVLGLLDQRGLPLWTEPRPPGPLMIAALGMLLAVTFAIQISADAQAWALKPGRSVAEVAPLLRLLQLVGGFFFAAFTLRLLF
jgi:hypothetical protein